MIPRRITTTPQPPISAGVKAQKYAQQGFVLVDSSGRCLGLSYAAITSNDAVKEGNFRVTIIGADGESAKKEMRKLQIRTIQQKRELLQS